MEKVKTEAEIALEKKQQKEAVGTAEKAFNEFEVKTPEDLQKSFMLMKTVLGLKGASEVKNFDEKIAAIEEAMKVAETAKDAEVKEIKEKLEISIKAFDQLQTRIGKVNKEAKSYLGKEIKSFNEHLVDAINDNLDAIKAHSKKGSPELKIEMKAVGDMNLAANFPGATPFIQQVQNRLIETPYNRVWLADLLPTGTSVGNSIIYPKENGGEGGSAVWTDRTANKSQMDFDLTSQSAFFKWIAGWVEIDREMLDDVPFLLSYLQSKMLISLKTAENDFILNGTTDTNPVDGLLDVATAYDGTYTAAVDRLIDAGWGQIVEDTFDFYNPTTAILTPRDAVSIGLNKASGSGEYDLPNGSVAFANGRLQVGGLLVAPTTQIGTNNFLVFDKNATMLVRRMQPELRMFEDAVLAKKNRVMFRVEERLTLAIFNNSAIVTGELVEGS